jgi:hypothetical protein
MNEPITLPENVRSALGLALQILEKLPEKQRPESNMDDMRGLLAGQSSGRDGLIVSEAIALALAYQTQRAIIDPPLLGWIEDGDDRELRTKIVNTRMREIAILFELVRQIDARSFPSDYMQACMRVGAAR